jgi:hypothetical protein
MFSDVSPVPDSSRLHICVRLVHAWVMTLFGNLFGSSQGGAESNLFNSSNPFAHFADGPRDTSGVRSDAAHNVSLDNAIATLECAKGAACGSK